MKNLKDMPVQLSSAKSRTHEQNLQTQPQQEQYPRQEEDSRRSELITKSARLFREKGYEKTTVRDIAAAAGMQAGSWFYHFKTKQDILVAVMEQGMTRSLQDIEAILARGLPPRETFRQLVRTHLQTLLAPNNDFIAVLLYEGRSLDEQARTRIVALTDRYEALWDGVIEALHSSGEWPSPTRFDRLFLFGTLNWTAQWFRSGAGTSIEDLAEQAIQFLLRAPQKPVES
ncbi:TetR/AcrR family transcriptional regulator [Noviherbaspirillum massiliense]|uniref:TetR/AcrR family transcriptional regulator n=1 Tax=Noviherbaspirillum massiliense TaxID=1465823 RepID=UPI0002D7ABB5|nr:TetR/AcrR family transcriptional regulator [Noviherbaspirillum massiliense]